MRFALFNRLYLLFAVVLFLSTLQVGCGEKDVPFIVDTEILQDYLAHNIPAKQLFRVEGLINPDPYSLPGDSITRTDSLISSRRLYDIHIVSNSAPDETKYVDYGWGVFRESAVKLIDSLTIQRKTVYPDSTTLDTSFIRINRWATFLKLGDDAQEYAGWSLWGVSYDHLPSDFVVLKQDQSVLAGDLSIYRDSLIGGFGEPRFIKLSKIDSVSAGSRLNVRYGWATPGVPPLELTFVSDYDNGGAFTRPLERDLSGKLDSLSYTLPSSNQRLYNSIYIGTGQNAGYFAPYRIK